MTVSLPTPGGDNGVWGTELNTFLGVSLNSDGTIKTSAAATALSGAGFLNLTPGTGTATLGELPVALSSSSFKWARHPVDWINVVNEYGADRTGVSDATTAINNALSAASAGQVVYLPQGTYLVSAPVVVPNGVLLLGAKSVSPGSNSSVPGLNGTVIKASGSWTRGSISASNNPGVVYVNGDSTTLYHVGIENLWVDLRLAPSSTHGISIWGGCLHSSLRNFGVVGQATGSSSSGTGNLLMISPDTQPTPNHWDGGFIENAVLQNAVNSGVWFHGQNSRIINVQVAAWGSSTASGSGFYLDNANKCQFTMCRSEHSGDSGWVIDSNPGTGSPNSPEGTVTLVSCGTSNNYNYGVKVINSSSSGSAQVRTPVNLIGCTFAFDGRQGGVNPSSGAGIYVQGKNAVNVIGCNVTTGGNSGSGNGHFYPEYGLVTATPGVPQRVYVRGGVWNCNSGPVLDGATASPTVDVGAVVGSAWTNTSTIASYTLNVTAGMSNPMNAPQQIIVGGTAGTPTALSAGTNGQVLGIAAGVVTWINNPVGFVSPMNTAGDMIIQTSSGPGRLGVGLNGQFLGVVAGLPTWVNAPSGGGGGAVITASTDTSGVQDTKNIVNAINSLPNGGVVTLGPGKFYITYVPGWSNAIASGGYSGMTGIAVIVPAQTTSGNHGGNPVCLRGSGAATEIHVVGNFIGIYHHRSISYGGQFNNVADPSAGTLSDFVIDGSSTTGANVIGLDVGDARGIHVERVTCQNFDSPGQIGCQIVNRISWTEKSWFQIEFYNNTTACVLTTKLSPGGDHSNEYNDYNFTLFANMDQQGIIVDGTNQGGSNLWLKGNMCQTSSSTATPTNGSYANTPCAALAIINNAGISDPAGHRWYAGTIWIKIEYNETLQFPDNNPPKGTAPYGLYSDGVGYVLDTAGHITHSLTNSKWNGAQFQFFGHTGDPNIPPTAYV